MPEVLSQSQRSLFVAYRRAANYLSVGQIYLYNNPLLNQIAAKEHNTAVRRWSRTSTACVVGDGGVETGRDPSWHSYKFLNADVPLLIVG